MLSLTSSRPLEAEKSTEHLSENLGVLASNQGLVAWFAIGFLFLTVVCRSFASLAIAILGIWGADLAAI